MLESFLDPLIKLSESGTNLTFTLIFFTAIIVLYSVFVFYFYQFLAKKNILELNLGQYNKYANPTVIKFFAVIFYILEYIILLPILTFFWFAFLAILILVLAQGMQASTVLLISTALIASVRATSYVSQTLSKDLAKMVPFTLLTIAITNKGFFQITPLLGRITEIPSLFSDIPYYLLFIVLVELTMRLVDFANNLFSDPTEDEDDEDD